VNLPLLRPAAFEGIPGVGAAMSTRAGGVSPAPWAELNLGRAVGDDAARVQANRDRFEAALGGEPVAVRAVWLRQVHGTTVRRLTAADLADGAADPPADAAVTTEPGIACTVMVADCLPVLLGSRDGRVVGAAHAGWRGLASGVLEATLAAMQDAAGSRPEDIVAWLGPCIGPPAFEVGADVVQAFGVEPSQSLCKSPFVYRPRPDGSPRWRADLPALAAARLRAAGVDDVQAEGRCTVAEGSAFFSYRRDGITGRMAAAIWRRG